jgi:hypothetical protein
MAVAMAATAPVTVQAARLLFVLGVARFVVTKCSASQVTITASDPNSRLYLAFLDGAVA